MKKFGFILSALLLFSIMACKNNSNEKYSETPEPIVKDSLGITTGAPITAKVDSTEAKKDEVPANTTTNPNFPGMLETTKHYANDKGGKITATYLAGPEIKIVTLEKDGQIFRLMRLDARNQEMIFTNGHITWTLQQDNGIAILDKDKVTTTYKLVDEKK